jgi:predicted component of type VI protein secretion system
MQDGRTRKVDAPEAASVAEYLDTHRACITVMSGPVAGHEYAFADSRILVGRSPNADLRLEEDSVSQEHAIFEFDTRGFGIRDVGSTNGVRVNGATIQACGLKHGDRISLGSCELQYIVEKRSRGPRAWVVDDA